MDPSKLTVESQPSARGAELQSVRADYRSARLAVALPILMGSLSAVTMVICYRLAISSGRVHGNYFYISSAFDAGTPHVIGTILLPLVATLMFAMANMRWLMVETMIRELVHERHERESQDTVNARPEQLRRCNVLALRMAAAAYGTFLVAVSCSVSTQFAAHAASAGLTLLIHQIIFALHTHLDRHLGHGHISRRLQTPRQALAAGATLGSWMFMLTVPRSPPPPTWDPAGTADVLPSWSECIAMGCFVAYYVTWMAEFSNIDMRLELTVRS